MTKLRPDLSGAPFFCMAAQQKPREKRAGTEGGNWRPNKN